MSETRNLPDLTLAESANLLAIEIGSINRDHGFHEDWDIAEELESLATAVRDGSIDEGPAREPNALVLEEAAKVLRLNILGTKLMLATSELAEALDALRSDGLEGLGEGEWGEELADTKIRIDDVAHMTGVSIGNEVMRKVAKNRDRPYKHGRKF